MEQVGGKGNTRTKNLFILFYHIFHSLLQWMVTLFKGYKYQIIIYFFYCFNGLFSQNFTEYFRNFLGNFTAKIMKYINLISFSNENVLLRGERVCLYKKDVFICIVDHLICLVSNYETLTSIFIQIISSSWLHQTQIFTCFIFNNLMNIQNSQFRITYKLTFSFKIISKKKSKRNFPKKNKIFENIN